MVGDWGQDLWGVPPSKRHLFLAQPTTKSYLNIFLTNHRRKELLGLMVVMYDDSAGAAPSPASQLMKLFCQSLIQGLNED